MLSVLPSRKTLPGIDTAVTYGFFFYFCPSVSPTHKNNPKSKLQHVRVPLNCVLSWCLRASEDDWTFALRIPIVQSLSLMSLLMLHKLGGLSFESPMVMYGLDKASLRLFSLTAAHTPPNRRPGSSPHRIIRQLLSL